MDEAAAERIRKARGEKVSSPLSLPVRLPRVALVHTTSRTSSPDEHPLPPGRTRGGATPERVINRAGTAAAAAAAGSKVAAAGSEAGRSAVDFRNVLDRGMGVNMDGRLLSRMDRRRPAGSGHGRRDGLG